jgi:hypothetical protein
MILELQLKGGDRRDVAETTLGKEPKVTGKDEEARPRRQKLSEDKGTGLKLPGEDSCLEGREGHGCLCLPGVCCLGPGL